MEYLCIIINFHGLMIGIISKRHLETSSRRLYNTPTIQSTRRDAFVRTLVVYQVAEQPVFVVSRPRY